MMGFVGQDAYQVPRGIPCQGLAREVVLFKVKPTSLPGLTKWWNSGIRKNG